MSAFLREQWAPEGITIPEWDQLADLVERGSVPGIWHDPSGKPHRYQYLVVDGYCYWLVQDILNRADVSTIQIAAPPLRSTYV